MKISALFITAFLLFFPSGTNTDKMQWSETRKLTWADFQGIPNRGADYVASTNSGISFSYSISNKNGEFELDYSVLSNFYPKESWYKPEAASEYILKHEQTHFDISELFARKLRKRLESISVEANIKEVVDKLYAETEQERRAMQSQYDAESDHSKNKEGEFRWRAYVAQELDRYANWK